MLRYVPLVLKNAWRNRRRTVLTILSIAASLSLLGILMAIYAAFYFSEPPPEQALRLAVRNKVSLVFPLPEAYREKGRFNPPGQPKHTRQREQAWAYSAIANGRLYVRDLDVLWCYDVKSDQ